MTKAPTVRLQPDNKGTKRGKVVEWSVNSRLRLRRYMLTHEPVVPSHEANVTLTIPGPPPSVEEVKHLWKYYCREVQRCGWSSIWRMEIQKRGAIHWHMIITIPKRQGEADEIIWEHWVSITELWFRSLDQLGKVEHHCEMFGREGDYIFNSRSDIPNADVIGASAVFDKNHNDNKWAWRRYMQDHASKSKQEQIAVGFGRHWGVVGRNGYKSSTPDYVTGVSDAEYFRVVRWLQRMVSGTIRCKKAPFGSRKAKRNRRGTHGQSVWFSNPATVRRFVDLAQALTSPG